MNVCKHCGEPNRHPETHPDMCCDHYDLTWGMSLEAINKERAERGAVPLTEVPQ